MDVLELVGCADMVFERAHARAKEYGTHPFTVDEMLAHPDVQIIINLTIPAAHGEIGLRAVRAGKSVYNEKPLAATREQAREQQRLAREELGQARSQLAMRTVRSPLTGIVVERYMSAGERIEDKPMIRVAVVDPLRVQVVLPSSMYGRVSMGAAVTVTPELANASAVTARVLLIDKILDAASNTFRVTLRLPNPGNALPAGLRCRADFGLSSPRADKRITPAAKG
jgi:multidrug efflux pump subunit AcrA (membrane-fusion protein)